MALLAGWGQAHVIIVAHRMTHIRARTAFLFVLAIYLVTAGGHVDTIDADASIETAYAILHNGTLATHPQQPDPMLYRETPSGEISKMGWVLPIVYLPYVVLSKCLSVVLPIPERLFSEFLISFVNSFLTLAILLFVYMHLRWSGHQSSQATFICLVLGLGTLLFPYAKTVHREPLQALLLVALAVTVFHPEKTKLADGFWIGLLASLGFLTKMALVLPMLPFLALYLAKANARNRLLFLICPLIGGFTQSLIGLVYYGTPFNNGYGPEVLTLASPVWTTPLPRGIFEQWLAWDTGLLPHCPVVILPIALTVREAFHKRLTLKTAVVLFAIALQTILYARWFSPTGGAALGPRYLIVVLPLFALLIPTTEWQLNLSTQLRFFVVLLLSWSFFQQTVNASVKAQQYWSMRALSAHGLPMPHWMANIELFFHKSEAGSEMYDPQTFGGEDPAPLDLRGFKTLTGLDYWWLHASRLWAENEPLKKSEPKPITIGQMHTHTHSGP
ncbi:MAG: hypothetical protein KDD51_12990 [Bdellovibrionales bacterium]|nr:hypothetical protein [Bdellovibrionales bacterium]